MASPAPSWATEVGSFASTPESGEIRPSTGPQPRPRSKLASEHLALEESKNAEPKTIFDRWDDDEEVVI